MFVATYQRQLIFYLYSYLVSHYYTFGESQKYIEVQLHGLHGTHIAGLKKAQIILIVLCFTKVL